MAITPLQDITPTAPHVPLGQKIQALNAAADQRTLTQQAIQANKLKLNEQQQQLQDEQGLNRAVAAGGSDEDLLKASRGVSSDAFFKVRTQIANASKAERDQISANIDSHKAFTDLMADKVATIKMQPTDQQPALWQNIVHELKASKVPGAENLPDQYDPNVANEFLDAKQMLDLIGKDLANTAARNKESFEQTTRPLDILNKQLTNKKLQSEVDNAGQTPDLQEFNKSGYIQTYYKNHNIDPMSLNPITEAQHRGQAFVEFKQNQTRESNPTEWSLALKAAKGDPIKALKIVQDAKDQTMSLTPEALDMAALKFAKTGDLVALGMGNASAQAKQAIINRAAVLYPHIDIAANAADYASNKDAERKRTEQLSLVTAFENTASKNLDMFLDRAKGVYDSGSPWINTPLRLIDQKGLGSDDLAAFNAARQVAINEIAKVTNSSNLSNALSDSARHEVEAFIPANATLKQIYEVAGVLKADMHNRTGELQNEIKAIQTRIAGPVGNNDNTNKPKTVKMKAPNGQTSDVPADQVEHYKSLGAVVQ